MEVRRAALEEIVDLRWDVIIRSTDRTSPDFPGDKNEESIHVGAFEAGQCIGCATFLMSEWEGTPAWQLRGMATHPDWRHQGIGRAMLACAEDLVRAAGDVRLLWCNARENAVGFYEKTGWAVVGDRFLTPGVGFHFRMVKRVGDRV